MFDGTLASILQSLTREYVKTRASDVRVGISGGHLVLDNAELRADSINKQLKAAQIPIQILSAAVGRLRVHVPWSALTSAPVEVYLENVQLLATLDVPGHSSSVVKGDQNSVSSFRKEKSDGQLNSGTKSKRANARLNKYSSQIDFAEIRRGDNDDEEDDSSDIPITAEDVQSLAFLGWHRSLLGRLLFNMRVEVNGMKLEYSDTLCRGWLSLASLVAESAGENWEPSFVPLDKSAQEVHSMLLRKLISLHGLNVVIVPREATEGKVSIMDSFEAENPIVNGLGITVKSEISVSGELHDSEAMATDILLDLDDPDLCISMRQFNWLSKIMEITGSSQKSTCHCGAKSSSNKKEIKTAQETSYSSTEPGKHEKNGNGFIKAGPELGVRSGSISRNVPQKFESDESGGLNSDPDFRKATKDRSNRREKGKSAKGIPRNGSKRLSRQVSTRDESDDGYRDELKSSDEDRRQVRNSDESEITRSRRSRKRDAREPEAVDKDELVELDEPVLEKLEEEQEKMKSDAVAAELADDGPEKRGKRWGTLSRLWSIITGETGNELTDDAADVLGFERVGVVNEMERVEHAVIQAAAAGGATLVLRLRTPDIGARKQVMSLKDELAKEKEAREQLSNAESTVLAAQEQVTILKEENDRLRAKNVELVNELGDLERLVGEAARNKDAIIRQMEAALAKAERNLIALLERTGGAPMDRFTAPEMQAPFSRPGSFEQLGSGSSTNPNNLRRPPPGLRRPDSQITLA